jgi:hypothetical protein
MIGFNRAKNKAVSNAPPVYIKNIHKLSKESKHKNNKEIQI